MFVFEVNFRILFVPNKRITIELEYAVRPTLLQNL